MSLQEQVNFCFPLRVLANDKVKLVPLEVSDGLVSCNIASKLWLTLSGKQACRQAV